MRQLIKEKLQKASPAVFHFVQRSIQFFRGVIKSIDTNYLHFNLDRRSKGAPIVRSEPGFIFSFIRNSYFTFHLRPKKTSDIYSQTTDVNNDFAIVIQGPIGKYCDFLLETIKLYQKTFPSAHIIVSTWKNEKNDIIDLISNLGVVVLLSDVPDVKGFGNINLQVVSAYKGIKYASDNNIKYCIKTRPDCRMYRSNIGSYLKGVLDTFGLSDSCSARGRIVATSVNTCKYKVYGITDILLFGYTKDLEIYFDPQDFEEGLVENGFGKYPAIINNTPVVSETYLCARYLKKIGVELDWTLEHWWYCLKGYFCVIDSDSIDLFWYKTDWMYEKRFYRSYASKSHRAVEFSDWLALYALDNIFWDKVDYQEKWIIDEGKTGNDIFKKISIF